MVKISSPQFDHRHEEEYSKSNSNHVNQANGDSLATLEPPPLQFALNDSNEEKKEEESQEKELGEVTFDLPNGEDGSEDDESNSNDGDTSSNPMEGSPDNIPDFDQIKHQFEEKFGYNLNDTTIHSNSSEPAKYGANAFAKGSEIHLGPGQEKHLGHEMAHVIQQKQGKVKPTSEKNGFQINDDPILENEADSMSQDAMQFKAFRLPPSPLQKEGISGAAGIYQFNKPDQGVEKVERKISLAIPSKTVKERDFKYVKASLNVATGAEVAFQVEKNSAGAVDEVAVGEKGIALKKESKNLVSKEIEQKLNLEVKSGLEINSFGGKVGIDCKLGEQSIFSGTGVEFSFIDVDWSESDPLDKIKILVTTLKSPELTKVFPFTFQDEPHKLTAKIQLQVELEASKVEILKQIITKFGHLFTAEVAISGGLLLGGAMTIAGMIYTAYMSKELPARVDALVDDIVRYGKGFMSGFTGDSTGGSIQGFMQGINARISAYNKMPPAVFHEKLKSEGVGSTFSDAMYQATQSLKEKAIAKFNEDALFESDKRTFRRTVEAACSSKHLMNRLAAI